MKPRSIRVFVSSTFRDMYAEREELVKRVFPRIRKLCSERGVAFSEVDLRWGITEDQAERGEVLPICLAEIDRCRPYFICLVGERYGFVPEPESISQELIEEQPWLREHREKSVTELEILHGVLRSTEMANRACFYFRDPAYVEQASEEERVDLVEGDSAAREKLARLKARIRGSGFALRENYSDPQELGELVLRDLTVVVNQEFPADRKPDPLACEADEHEAFAQSRTGVYLGRDEYFEHLDAHAREEEDGPGLVVLGESGSGKSALLANWTQRYREDHPKDQVLVHFIGATAFSADWAAMLRRILTELKRHHGIEQEIPERPAELASALGNWLHLAAARVPDGRRIVLVLDALDQLEDREGAPDLVWLPPVIPGKVRLIVSTLPGRPLDELVRRAWPALEVQPFDPDERRTFICDYLAQYTKQLGAEQAERIAASDRAASPLFLQALLEELRVFGVYERLDERIDHYLQAETVSELFERILARYEKDYDRDRPGLVRDAMSLLWAARRGLSEAELLDLLGTGDGPLPQAYWSPLFLASERALVSRSGRINFFHDYLRRAVRDRYLDRKQERSAAHMRLARYFASQTIDERNLDELPWQLAEAEEWELLSKLLSDLPVLERAWRASQSEVLAHWTRLEAESELRLVDGYRSVLDNPAEHVDHLVTVARLLGEIGHASEALALWEQYATHAKADGDEAELSRAFGEQGLIVYARGDLQGAMDRYAEQERICRAIGKQDGLHMSLGNQALVLRTQGDYPRAIELLVEKERICRELGDEQGLHIARSNRAMVVYLRGDLAEAEQLWQEDVRECRRLGDRSNLGATLGNLALLHRDRGELEEAVRLWKEQEEICRELGFQPGLGRSLAGQALALEDRGDLDGAALALDEAMAVFRDSGDKAGLGVGLGNQANLAAARGDLDGAIRLSQEAEEIYRELGDTEKLGTAFVNRSRFTRSYGDLDGALELAKEAERIFRELDHKEGLGMSLTAQAQTLDDLGDLPGALRRHEQAAQLFREMNHHEGLRQSLEFQAVIHEDEHDGAEALALRKDQERLCRAANDLHGLARCLSNQAILVGLELGRLAEALALAEEAHRLAREHAPEALTTFERVLGVLRKKLEA